MLITGHRQEGSFIPIYLQGLTMGLAYVAPIGAQNLFMIQMAMGNDRKRAFLTAEQAPLFVMGTASASCLWFFGMTALLSFFREKISGTVLLWINRACGCVLMFYGAKLLWSFVQLPRG